MRRLVLLLMLIVSILALCACNRAKETSTDLDAGKESVDVTVTEDSSSTPTMTPTQTPTPTPSPSPAPTNTLTPTPTPKPEVKVKDAYRKVYNIYDTPRTYRYPKISISGVDTSKINKTLKKDLDGLLYYDPDEDSYYGPVVDYEYYISDNVISIVATLSETDFDYWDYKVYNISIATGKKIDDKVIVAEYGMSDDEFFDKVKKIYKDFNAGVPEGFDDIEDKSLIKSYNKKNQKMVSYKYIKPYFNSKGHLCFMGYVYFIGGADEGNCLFDATDTKAIW